MQFPITIGLHRSRFLVVALLLGHGLALAGMLATPWPLEIRAALSLLVLLLLGFALRSANPQLKAIHLFADGRCTVFRAGAEAPETSTLLAGIFVHPLLTVFRLQTDDTTEFTVVVLPDTTASEDHRRLRVWLLHKAKIGGDDDV